jgi:hypothetical protein
MSSDNTSDNDRAADRQRTTGSLDENGRGAVTSNGHLGDRHTGDAADIHPVRRSSMTAATRKQVLRLCATLLTFLAASLIMPAATKQWSDRSDEIAMKRDLISRITEASTEAVLTADCVVSFCLPEYALVSDDNADPAAVNASIIAYRRALVVNDRAWAKAKSVTDDVLGAYFSDTRLEADWEEYAFAVDAYLRVGQEYCGAARDADMNLLRGYLSNIDPQVWADLLRDLNEECTNTPVEFPPAYSEVANELLARREVITDNIIQADAAGYSDGFEDFVHDLFLF